MMGYQQGAFLQAQMPAATNMYYGQPQQGGMQLQQPYSGQMYGATAQYAAPSGQTPYFNENQRTVNTNNAAGAMKMKDKSHDPTQPTRVLYVRNLPDVYTEMDVTHAVEPYGKVTGIFLQKEKRHGFVEFSDLNQATNVYNHFKMSPWTAHGRTIEFNWSGRQNIERKSDIENNPPNKILLVTVSNIMYPVTIEVLATVFQKYGGAQRIIIFQRQQGVQALVQLPDTRNAISAKQELDGQNIYAGCNTLKVQFSSMDQLTVRQNNEKSWDFITPPPVLPTNQPGMPQQAMGGLGLAGLAPQGMGLMGGMMGGMMGGVGVPVVLMVRGLDENRTKTDELASLFAVYGNVQRVKIMFHKRDSALVQVENMQQATAAKNSLNGIALHGKRLAVDFSKGGAIPKPIIKQGEQAEAKLTKDYSEIPNFQRHKAGKVFKCFSPSSSLHIANMPDGTTEEQVRELFSSIGLALESVKFIQERNYQAIVHLGSQEAAIEALVTLHNRDLGGRSLRVSFASFAGAK